MNAGGAARLSRPRVRRPAFPRARAGSAKAPAVLERGGPVSNCPLVRVRVSRPAVVAPPILLRKWRSALAKRAATAASSGTASADASDAPRARSASRGLAAASLAAVLIAAASSRAAAERCAARPWRRRGLGGGAPAAAASAGSRALARRRRRRRAASSPRRARRRGAVGRPPAPAFEFRRGRGRRARRAPRAGLDADNLLENYGDSWEGHLAACYSPVANSSPRAAVVEPLVVSGLLERERRRRRRRRDVRRRARAARPGTALRGDAVRAHAGRGRGAQGGVEGAVHVQHGRVPALRRGRVRDDDRRRRASRWRRSPSWATR